MGNHSKSTLAEMKTTWLVRLHRGLSDPVKKRLDIISHEIRIPILRCRKVMKASHVHF